MIRKQIYLTENLNDKLNDIASSRGIPQSEVIREGLELYLTECDKKEESWNDLFEQMKQSAFKSSNWSRDELYLERTKIKGRQS
ncbi:MAG: Ribbon-helix-helix domain [Paenibacillaceae bacterium]|nr:Ribbon-helix-helix domain [Paenibacillaceae bacterium]